MFPSNTFYSVATALRLTGSLNASALEETFNKLRDRYETLRTTFVIVEGDLLQVIAPSLTIPVSVIDLRHLPATEREAETRHPKNRF